MDMIQIKVEKQALERDITEQLKKFEQKTGMVVDGVTLRKVSGMERSGVHYVNLDVKIP